MAKAARKVLVEGVSRPEWVGPVGGLLGLLAMAGAFGGYVGLSGMPANPTLGWGGIGALVVAVTLAALVISRTKRELRVDREGITMRVGSGEPVQIQWSEPHDYYYREVTGSSTPSVVKARLETADGRRIDLDAVKLADYPNANVPALAEQHSTTANLATIKAKLEAGEEVEFGPLRLTSDRIAFGEHSHAREKGLVLNIEEGRVEVGIDGGWISSGVSVHEVANYPSLLRAIGQIRRARAPT